MSASDSLSNELFFKAHRGLLVRSSMDKHVDEGNLGMHWSVDPEKAKEFATKSLHWPDRTGYVYHSEIPISAVETDTKRLRDRGFANFMGQDPFGEKEVPVKENAPVKITGRTKYRVTYTPARESMTKGRTRRYNPPREMKA